MVQPGRSASMKAAITKTTSVRIRNWVKSSNSSGEIVSTGPHSSWPEITHLGGGRVNDEQNPITEPSPIPRSRAVSADSSRWKALPVIPSQKQNADLSTESADVEKLMGKIMLDSPSLPTGSNDKTATQALDPRTILPNTVYTATPVTGLRTPPPTPDSASGSSATAITITRPMGSDSTEELPVRNTRYISLARNTVSRSACGSIDTTVAKHPSSQHGDWTLLLSRIERKVW
ncbi:hypothetical protein QC764_001160 [Podospora pseudoanserina]|uniref:Uncharacterized protein n=1 Tax=Podospora pseudoanserina TaxID=2609844 RepID=A0ABR0IFI2_9PEZI|nr:hypothetical protein QC764_001160 [Podospora pseudoanserina]